MLQGSRKEYVIKNNLTLDLSNYTAVFLHNKGGSTVSFGAYSISASKKHSINTNNVAVTESVNISFDKENDNNLYISVVSVIDCNN